MQRSINFYEDNHIIAQGQSLLCHSEQWSDLVLFCHSILFYGTHAFVFPTNKATIRFLLWLKSVAQIATHFLQSQINNHHHWASLYNFCSVNFLFYTPSCLLTKQQSDIIVTLSHKALLSVGSQMSSIFPSHKLFLTHIWHGSIVNTLSGKLLLKCKDSNTSITSISAYSDYTANTTDPKNLKIMTSQRKCC
jgi:hypothetical protein